MSIQLEARHAALPDIIAILEDHAARATDLVVSSSAISAVDGNLVIADTEATRVITGDGVTRTAGTYRPTAACDDGIGQRLDIPAGYLKVLRGPLGRPDLWDANVNGMLHGGTSALAPAPDYAFPGFGKLSLLRLLRGDPGEPGVARALLSPKYKFIDNLDTLLAIMDGIRQAGITAVPDTCDLSDSFMYARFVAPEIAALAPNLLDGYRSPFEGRGGVQRAPAVGGNSARPGMRMAVQGGNWDIPRALAAAAREGQGYEPGKEPVVWAGLVVSNSDVGVGARTIAPQIRIRLCRNGLTLLAEADRRIHLGSARQEGVITWSAETQRKELELITAQTVDAVKLFLSQDYLGEQVAKIEALAGTEITTPEVTVTEVAKAAGFTKAEAAGILAHFLRGGTGTAGGVANAVSSYSQTIGSADRAAEMDHLAIRAMELAAAA
jgi:hypothetical protein